MPRFTFPEWTETLKKWINLLVLGAPVYLVALIAYGVTPEALRIGYQPDQPVPYSHALHVGELGLDCRYCHSTVERAGEAAVPPAATCMNCHSTVKKDSDLLQPIRTAFAEGEAVRWTRVHDVPDYVYFNHEAHVNATIGCESCHGRIDQMVKVFQAMPLTMEWCINCHRDPTPFLRPASELTKMGYEPKSHDEGVRVGKERAVFDDERGIRPPTNCSTCHR